MIEAAEVITVEEEAVNIAAAEETIVAITVATSEAATEAAEKLAPATHKSVLILTKAASNER